MANVTKLAVKNNLFERVVGGNSDYKDKHHLSDLLNNYIRSRKDFNEVMDGTFLSAVTIERMKTLKESESGRDYNPSSDTLERLKTFFNLQYTSCVVDIKPRYRNKEKLF